MALLLEIHYSESSKSLKPFWQFHFITKLSVFFFKTRKKPFYKQQYDKTRTGILDVSLTFYNIDAIQK